MKQNQKKHLNLRLVVALTLGLTAWPLGARQENKETAAATNTTTAATAPETAENVATDADNSDKPSGSMRQHRSHGLGDARVVFGDNVELKKGETTEAVVVIGGNAKVNGKVLDAAVVIGGNLEIDGEVGDAAVAVMGNIHLRSNAVVNGDVVSVGGRLKVDDGAVVKGEQQAVDFGGFGLPQVEPLRDWFVHCVLKLRLLAPQVGFVWIVAGGFFLFYLLIAIALPKPVQVCIGELTRRPATTILLGVLTKILLPIVLLILAATGIGLIVIPFLLAALLFGALVGKVALLQFLGDSLRRATGAVNPFHPALALFVGSLVLVLLYMVPLLGLITFAVTAVWGLGLAVSAMFGSMKREMPEKPVPATASPTGFTPAPAPMPMPMAPAYSEAALAGNPAPASFNEANPAPGTSPAANPSPASAPAAVSAAVPEALTFPRARFWERMGAAFLDVVLVSILGAIVGGPPWLFLVALAYFAGMWAWRGTTVGGVVLGLKVVRLDNQPVSFAVALVRGLAAAFSVIVLFLGFLWIAWDKEKQGWHDRIAGTVVIRLPRGTPLV